ncbi:methylenetetrahydrofolate reductase [NAD(P)H] [Paraliomyxa miuraensis]|uniref:methylenetetrahydrofolate reductase [NAD(P)H] n=1 Tax=Paraliomyxa miuraensis TaxID=376150 RepID=UPI0022598036|nr:methylenetetrahydrofolate reductase [NAD(P)H] [Paraliomyxa miuraensis]MCX4243531.1 methylenetetrahydrofolate reductase [NAD(P)H] [Paraliomyxa miuraensis]
MLIRERLRHKRPVFSFEFFPPKTEQGEASLLRALERLAPLEPDFVSVTYGAGGSTRARTLEIVTRIKREFGIEAMAHLTCVGSTRDELAAVIDKLGDAGVHNVLALRGDPPRGRTEFEVTPGGFRFASDLVAFIHERGDFCVGVACYPEVHPEAVHAAADLAHLRTKVDAGADFLVSQLFFDNARFFEFVGRVKGAGIEVPVLAGIMPVTNVTQIQRFTQMIGASIPPSLARRLEAADGDPQEVFWTGVSYAAHQCRELLRPPGEDPFERPPRSVAGIHFYTLNKSPASRAIFQILRIAHTGLG